jgi:hypothetical protein
LTFSLAGLLLNSITMTDTTTENLGDLPLGASDRTIAFFLAESLIHLLQGPNQPAVNHVEIITTEMRSRCKPPRYWLGLLINHLRPDAQSR